MSQNPPETTSNLTYDLVFENALKAYKKKTGKDLASDPLLRRLETCNSPDGVLGTLREQVPDSDQPETRNDRLMTGSTRRAVSPVYPPAGLIFMGISSLLSVVQAVSATQDEMISLFERIENYFRRLEMYIGLPRTTGMMEIIVKVMTEVLIILGLATREVKQGKIKRCLKKLIGRSDIKDALQRLDNLMQEESRMAAAQGLKATHGLEERVVGIRDDVQGVGDMLRDVVIDGGERLRGELQRSCLHSLHC
ncbi:hypothetical protein BC826DRAFT_1108113 [Russula brevipes]|nr:hypothetical protein BC826DRAFT_1108113 [Russula brevipes]